MAVDVTVGVAVDVTVGVTVDVTVLELFVTREVGCTWAWLWVWMWE